MPDLAEDSINWFEMKGIAVRLQGRIVLEKVDWSFEKKEHWAILGGNGAGKSTILRILAQQISYCKGTLRRHPELQGVTHLGWVHLNQPLRLLAHEKLKDRWEEYSGKEQKQQTIRSMFSEHMLAEKESKDLLHLMQLDSKIDRPIRGLSNGEWRKLLLFQSLILLPKLLMLDEPFDGLDKNSSKDFKSLLRELVQHSKLSLILVSHRQDELIPEITDVMGLRNGKIEYSGRRSSVLNEPNLKKLYRSETKSTNTRKFQSGIIVSKFRNIEDSSISPVKMENVHLYFQSHTVFKDFSWTWPPGEHWQVAGPNGSGKSSLVKLIVGEHLQAYSNKVWIFGKRRGSGENIWDLRKRIGMVTPELQMNYHKKITGRKVVYSGFNDSIGYYGAISEQQKETAENWLNQFDLFEIAENSFLNMSYGQQRLFLLARAMVKSPEILLLDEPCQGLDPYQRSELINNINLLGKSKATQILYISHQVEDKLDCIGATIFLPDGRIERNLSAFQKF
ncbi:MAG: ATP-binding cassette domain-containing protein [SAR324 cluster bacterium]|nr:ATP-binding cassette domain-containing protein [SAR324 cluster bacterium]